MLVLLVLLVLLAACEAPSFGFGESRAPAVTVNVSPVANYGPGSPFGGDTSAWGDSVEGPRSGTNTPTTTTEATVPVNVNPSPVPAPAPPTTGNAKPDNPSPPPPGVLVASWPEPCSGPSCSLPPPAPDPEAGAFRR